ncbi:MAG: apolipoprotein N-acyltransferase [Thermoanaerobaculales bacterium]|nr:apolipoprotein N-acyltransferase [Thermoanaerobaculales bacterium]
MKAVTSGVRSILLAVAAGLTLALAMPGPGWWPLLLVFPGLLLAALQPAKCWWHGALLAWLAGTVHWMVAVHWVVDVLSGYGGLPIVAAWGSLLLMGAILGSTWAAAGAVTLLAPAARRVWVFPAVFIVFEVLRRYSPFLFPWNTVASCFSSLPGVLGSLAVWGATGLGWATVAFGAGVWALFDPDTRRSGAVTVAAAFLLAGGATIVAPDFQSNGEKLKVAVIQPGTTLEERWDPDSWAETAERVWGLSREAAEQHPDMILWPESAMPYRIDVDPGYRLGVHRLAEESGAVVVLNSVVAAPSGGYYNSAFAVHPAGSLSRYDKMRLVPFGEYVPAWAKWFFSDALVNGVGDFTAGEEARPLPADVPLGMAVCYEIVFPNLSALQVRNGAQVLVTLTNDAWYGASWALDQHFAHAVLRAVENRRWVIRAALTGISGVVDPGGRVRHRLEAGRQGVLLAEVHPSKRLTWSSRWGDWWALVSLVTVLAGISGRMRSHRSPR